MTFDDYQEITRRRYEYALGIDTRDWALHRSIFTPEIQMDFTSYSGGEGATLMTADAWIDNIRPLFTGLTATQHTMTNPMVSVDGHTARQTMYMQALHFLDAMDDADSAAQGEFAVGGYYEDELVRTGEGWRIQAVKLTVLWRRGDARIMVAARHRGMALMDG